MKKLENYSSEKTLSKEDYNIELPRLQLKMRKLQLRLKDANRPLIVVMEGWDAAGKGGSIRRITSTLDPRAFKVTPVAAPTAEELAHHYLWRFAIRLPDSGKIQIFDRSWYGRVLVERIEGFAKEEEWKRAFEEINIFERHFVDAGGIMCKFFMHINKDEQLARFEARKDDPLKSWKLTDEDWRNRDKWDEYSVAIDDMLAKTDRPGSPWYVIPGNCKKYARVELLKQLTSFVKHRLES